MENVRERSRKPAKPPAPQGTWVQITFTLDTEQYQRLWERAEAEHRTISDLVHDCVTGFLGEMGFMPRKRNKSMKRNAEDPS